MTVSGPTLIAALLMGDPLNKPKTLEEISNEILQTLTLDPPALKEIVKNSNTASTLIAGPSNSLTIRENNSKTRALRYDNLPIRKHITLDSNTVLGNSLHSAHPLLIPPIERLSRENISKQTHSTPLKTAYSFTTTPLSPINHANLSTNSTILASGPRQNKGSSITRESTKIQIDSLQQTTITNENVALQIAVEDPLTIKEDEVTTSNNTNMPIPKASIIPGDSSSPQKNPVAEVKRHLPKKKEIFTTENQILIKNVGEELSQALASRAKTETTQNEECLQKEVSSQQSENSRTLKPTEILSEVAQSSKQQRDFQTDLLSLIQTTKLKPMVPQEPKPSLTDPLTKKDAVINTLRSLHKKGASFLKTSSQSKLESPKIKTLDELKTEFDTAKASGADKFTLRILSMQIQEVESMAQKVSHSKNANTATAEHQVKKVTLAGESKEKSSQIQKALKKVDPTKDEVVRQRILKGNGRTQKITELEANNAQALHKGTLSYEGPIVILQAPEKAEESNTIPIIQADENIEKMAPIFSSEFSLESISTASQMTIRTSPILPSSSFDGLLGALKRNITSREEEDDNKPLIKEEILQTFKDHQNDLGLSEQDLRILSEQSLNNLQPLIDEFYDKKKQQWDFDFADQVSIMACIKSSEQEEAKSSQKTVSRLNLKKSGGQDFLSSIREARGIIEGEVVATYPSVFAKNSVDNTIIEAPKASKEPKKLSAKSLEIREKLSQRKEETTEGNLLDQIRNNKQLINLKKAPSAVPTPEEFTPEDTHLKSALIAHRRSMKMEDELDDEWED
ncbi:MAG: hypothetical protein J0H12_00815 [Candidatus Paracaedimonas acanthamoebae]|uniref:WH2 domain-containing protein n=1 Tax=Candidatus Paracaedimonas acanthamoebae TaxID=244581 RepID=A0A8J7PGG1_9PROT|nr:hypothetical protein [Candidatus Paracaedimonas acanthamoebae]